MTALLITLTVTLTVVLLAAGAALWRRHAQRAVGAAQITDDLYVLRRQACAIADPAERDRRLRVLDRADDWVHSTNINISGRRFFRTRVLRWLASTLPATRRERLLTRVNPYRLATNVTAREYHALSR